MKKEKIISIILIIIGIFVGFILIDTIQARILKNSPFISWQENLADSDSWVNKGLLMDTYYCTKEQDIITVSWHFKTSKFTCPIDNNPELNEIENISMIIKDGTLTKNGATIIITDLTGNDTIYGQFFRIDKKVNNKWQELEVIVDGEYGWNSIGYSVDDNNELELKHNWKWLYGSLEKGEYRIVKEVNNKYFSTEFKIN